MRAVLLETRDAALLASLHAHCFRKPWSETAFLGLMEADQCCALLALHDEISSGFVLVRAAADEAEIVTLGVVPEWRGLGLGRMLVLSAAEHAHNAGAQTLFLEVNENNASAVALYRRLDFREVGRRRSYYRECDAVADALVLQRSLPIRMGIGVELP